MERWIKNLSFKRKLVLSFSLMLGLSFILGTALLRSLFELKRQAEDYDRLRGSQQIMADTEKTLDSMRSAVDGYLIGAAGNRQMYEIHAAEAEKNLEMLRRSAVLPLEKENARKLEIALKTFASQVEPVLELADRGQRNAAIHKMEDSALAALDGLSKKAGLLALSVQAQADSAWTDAKRLARQSLFSSALLFLSTLLAGMGLAIGLYRSVAHPLARLREGTRNISEGSWNVSIDVQDPPELAVLARSFEDMAKSLTRLQVRITQLDRMSAMGTLAGGVAHEINNPLTGVLGQAQFLLEKLSVTDPLRTNVERIERGAQKCRKIVRGLLDFSRPTDYLFQAFDVNGVVDHALGMCETEMTLKSIQVRRVNAPGLPKVWASENHLEQVFLNILLNALAAMPEGGRLTVQTSLERPGYRPHGLALNEGIDPARDYVAVTFADTGAGIEPQNLPRLFDPFFTTKEPGKGTGLGLSISYNVMKMHRGEIEAASPGPGKGAQFTVRIPAYGDESVAAAARSNFGSVEKRLDDFEKRFES